MDRKNRVSLPVVLVDEDDPELASLVGETLGPQVMTVVAPNWTDARARLKQTRFDLILLDLYLPDSDDVLAPLEAIREIDPDYPVIVMSGNIDLNDRLVDRAARLGVTTFLFKPFDLRVLVEKVAAMLPARPGPGWALGSV
jgi:DNA-binding NtrC family response regulator